MRVRGRARPGFALLSALWFMALLATLGVTIATRTRAERLAGANRREFALAQAGATSGLSLLRARLDRRAATVRDARAFATALWLDADTLLVDSTTVAPERFEVRVVDASSRLNLNLASADELRDLAIALRIDAGRADRLAQAIVDWRDGDDLVGPRGAERREYVRAGARDLPANAPFEDVAALRAVRDVDERTFALLAPNLTVRGSGLVNPNTASEAVLLSLPGFGPDAVAFLMRLRASRVPVTTSTQLLSLTPATLRSSLVETQRAWGPRLTYEVRELEVWSSGSVEGSPIRASASAVIVRAGTRFIVTEPRIRQWR